MTRFGWIGWVADLHHYHRSSFITQCTEFLSIPAMTAAPTPAAPKGNPPLPEGERLASSWWQCTNYYPILGCGWNIWVWLVLDFWKSHSLLHFTPHCWPGGFKFGVWGAETKRASTRLLHGGYRCEFQSTSAVGNPELQNQTSIGTHQWEWDRLQ